MSIKEAAAITWLAVAYRTVAMLLLIGSGWLCSVKR